MKRLIAHDERFERVQRALRFNKGQAGTTSPWSNTARALSTIYGPCWLAAEIAIIGAALPRDKFTTSGDFTRGSAPFGPAPEYGSLLREIRLNHARTDWWSRQFADHEDHLSRATWALAVVAAASPQVLIDNLGNLDTATRQLPQPMLDALVASSSRIGASGLARQLTGDVLAAAADLPEPSLLVAHYAAPLGGSNCLPQYSEQRLADHSRCGVGAWPALLALTARMTTQPSATLLSGIQRFGASAIQPTVDIGRETEEYARTIVSSPAAYPLAWVLAAEQRISSSADDPPLTTVADEYEWFPL